MVVIILDIRLENDGSNHKMSTEADPQFKKVNLYRFLQNRWQEKQMQAKENKRIWKGLTKQNKTASLHHVAKKRKRLGSSRTVKPNKSDQY